MKRSQTRILTTHTGSLPRPEGLVAMLGSVSRGEPVDENKLNEIVYDLHFPSPAEVKPVKKWFKGRSSVG